MTASVQYRIQPISLEAHLFDVTVTVPRPAKKGQVFSLPAWIPGSYMIREFARHIVRLEATSDGRPVGVSKLDKHSWQADPVKGELSLHYQVYAFDLSVRGAYLDTRRGFFNGSSVFVQVQGYEASPCEVEIVAPAGRGEWQVATSLKAREVGKKTGFGRYRAQNYDELIDHPVELGAFTRVTFRACGVAHEFVVSGEFSADLKRLTRDVKKICEWQIRLFGEPAPFDRYVFMLFVGKDIYGGLEHRASTALVANRNDLPQAGVKEIGDGYLRLLGLISHEYFHSWNVKRMKPAAFAPYDLAREGYTRLLWAFEGVTSYYDDLALVRSGVIDADRYLGLLAQTITGVERTAGRRVQTLEEASFDAWIKYYRQDENSPNSLVSYYTKGALASLALDLLIRRETAGSRSLDDVMRLVWAKWRRDGQGLAEDEWERLAEEATGLDLKPFFDRALRTTQDLPLAELLATQGVTLAFDSAATATDNGSVGAADLTRPARPTLGVKTAADALGLRLTHVLDGLPAQAAGLSGGDVAIAAGGLRVADADSLAARLVIGSKLKVHAFRRDELMTFNVVPVAAPQDTCRLSLAQGGAGWLKQ
ncbi:M61 family metallopeptidase [Paludibacterium yongneupense]|uniref:M61 family metallopeptidase n=1 Tax=Paludibacterium yongneupense TaxID=400061 RepID=UPI000411B17E|nr:PDZ domain-containing protein [Paludibacterium yongneupense]